MPALFIYLIKVNIALLIFCLGYYAVLRHLTFYTLNRAYLVTAIIFSTLYPFINLSAFINRHQEIARPVQVVVINWQAPAQTLVQKVTVHNQWYWLQMAFWLGVILLAIRFATQLLSLYRLHQQSKPARIRQYMIRVIKGDINPFSFWRNIYINPANHPPHELDAILEHEQIHVNDWHTLDILLGEISAICYWFNPGIWLMKKAIRENIEFITDRKILQKGIDCKVYQYSLINVNFKAQSNAIVNHFNISIIKKRIMMMNAKRSSSLNITRYMFLVPTVIALLLVFSVSKAELNKATNNSTHLFKKAVKTMATQLNINVMGHPLKHHGLLKTTGSPAMAAATPDTGKNESVTISGKIITLKTDTFYYKDKNGATMAVPVSGVVKKGTSNQLGKATKWRLNGVTYTKPQNDTSSLSNKFRTVKGRMNKLDTNQPGKTSTWKLNGVTYTLAKAKTDTTPSGNKAVTIKGTNTGNDEKSKEFSVKWDTSKFKGNPKMNIKGIVLEKSKMDSSLKAMQGWKVDKDGSVTKLGKPVSAFYFSIAGPINLKNKLIVIDGKEATQKELKKLSIDKIETINPVSPNMGFNHTRDTMVAKYGDKAKYGVIIITTKKKD